MSSVGEMNKNSGFTFTWYIEDFPLWLTYKDCVIDSPIIRVEQLKDTDWVLTILVPDDDEDNITLSLNRCENEPQESPSRIYVEGNLFIAKNDGTCIFSKKFSSYFQATLSSETLIISRNIILEDSSMFLREDTLTVGFQFFVNSSIPIECIGRIKFIWKEYSIQLPLVFPEIAVNGGQRTIISPVISTSPEHPRVRIYMNCNDFNNDFPITIQIQMSELVFSGFAKCNLLFFCKEVVKMKITTDYEFDRDDEFIICVINVSKATFYEHSLFKADRLKCELRVKNGEFDSFLEKTIYDKNMSASCMDYLDTSSLQSVMEKYVNNSLCDLKVIVFGREFFIHKTILAAVSPVFRAMFENCMIESEKYQVTINEFSIRTVEKMFEFVYSGIFRDLTWDDALELYSIADKYQIKKLRMACYSFLKSALRVERVPELLIFINPYNDAYLYKVAEDFICANSNTVFQSEVWKNFMKNNVQIACDTMYRICQSVLQ